MNGYDLSRQWFDFAFDKKECKVQHTALYLWIIELNNRLGWKAEFGLPMQATMEGLSIGNKTTYTNTLNDLEEWGFVKVVQQAKNQYQSCIIKICRYENEPALSKALDTALVRHSNQQRTDIESGTVTIDKPLNNETIKPLNNETDVDADRVGEEAEVKIEYVEKKEAPSPKVAPKGSREYDPAKEEMPFPTERFRETWLKWIKYRREIKKKLTETMAQSQLAKLGNYSEGLAIEFIMQSIESGWTGLFFEIKTGSRFARPSPEQEQPYKPGKIEASMNSMNAAYENIQRRKRELEMES